LSAGEAPPVPPRAGGTSRREWLGFAGLFGAIAVVIGAAVMLIAPRLACGCTPVSETPSVDSPVEGIVIAVDSSGLADVRGFTLRADGGFAFTFSLGALENAAEFSPSHLTEHQLSSEPIRVWFRVEGAERVVYRLEDAPG
jgi:hypothetical protein